jgi:hypothetical protein
MGASVADKMLEKMEPGRVYRTRELRPLSNNLSLDLKKLVLEKRLILAAPGLYYRPKQSRFGSLPADQRDLIRAFLGDENFLALSLSDYNPLGLGLTQMYNEVVVYNRRRHGRFELDGRSYSFRVRPDFPLVLSKEFLLVDVLNNRSELAEKTDQLEEWVQKRAKELDIAMLCLHAQRYGKVATRKFFEKLAP